MNPIRLSWLSLSLAAVLPTACQTDSLAPTPTTPDDPAPSRIGPEEVLARSIDRVRLGFQPSGDGFRAGTVTHDAEVEDGGLVMVPHDFDGQRAIDGAPVRFSTAGIQRGDVDLASGAGSTRLGDDGAIHIARGATTEVLENRDEGVEQRWHFPAAPEGDGDLVVAVSVSGHEQVSASRTGLHFLSGERLGFSYSHATWLDARRTAWNIPVSWEDDRIVMRVPASVLDRSAFPAVLDPIVGPQRAMDDPVEGFSGGAGFSPVVARSSDGNYLVVWTDDRNGNERETEIWATRVRASGEPLDRRGIPIAHTTIMEHEPAVAWTGTEWLVAWTREEQAVNAAIATATVSPTGEVTDLGIVAGTAGYESEPALASAGSGGALLAFRWNHQIRAMRYSGGAFGSAFTVSADDAIEGAPTVAASGSNYLVAWELGDGPGEDIAGRIINPSGTNPAAFTISAAPNTLSQPAATFDGTNYIVVWRRAADVWGSRVTTAGAVLDSTEGVGGVVIAATPNVQADPAITCSESQCLLAFADARDLTDPSNPAFDLVAQRLAFDLSPIGGEIAVNSFLRNQDEPGLTTVGTGAFLAVWTDARSGVRNVFATRISGTGAVLDASGELVNTSIRNAQNRPAYAIGDTTHLATWADSRNFGDDIMARRSDAAGNLLGDGAIVVSDAEWDQTGSAVAFDGSRYVVVWRDTRNVDADIFAARMAEDGTLEDPAGIPVTTAPSAQIAPDVASGGGVSLVAWQDRRDPASGYDLMGAILAADGSVAVADIPICQAPDEQVNASVAWDPNSSLFIVAWSDRRNEGSADIYAARVEPDGDVLDPCGVPISQGLNWQTNPDVAVSGSQVLVVWADFRDDFFGDVFGGRITAGAGGITRLDGEGAPIATGASWQTGPVAVGVGLGRWGIAWTDTVNENTAGTDILGQTMLADGTLEAAATVLSGGIYFETAPAFPSGSSDSNVTWLLYEYNRPSVGNLRVRRRQLTY